MTRHPMRSRKGSTKGLTLSGLDSELDETRAQHPGALHDPDSPSAPAHHQGRDRKNWNLDWRIAVRLRRQGGVKDASSMSQLSDKNSGPDQTEQGMPGSAPCLRGHLGEELRSLGITAQTPTQGAAHINRQWL